MLSNFARPFRMAARYFTSASAVMWYFDRPGVPASGHPQGRRLCLQPVLILLGHPAKQHKKFVFDITCFAFFSMLLQILIRVLKSERQSEHGL